MRIISRLALCIATDLHTRLLYLIRDIWKVSYPTKVLTCRNPIMVNVGELRGWAHYQGEMSHITKSTVAGTVYKTVPYR